MLVVYDEIFRGDSKAIRIYKKLYKESHSLVLAAYEPCSSIVTFEGSGAVWMFVAMA